MSMLNIVISIFSMHSIITSLGSREGRIDAREANLVIMSMVEDNFFMIISLLKEGGRGLVLDMLEWLTKVDCYIF